MADAFPQFADRDDAAARLVPLLEHLRDRHPLVLGIPRGGVPVAAGLCRALDGQLDLVVAHKLGAPGQPELAVGAITASGELFLDQAMVLALGIPAHYLQAEIARQQQEVQRRERTLRSGRAAPSIAGRTVVVTDDGAATGATVLAAVRSVRAGRPARLVVALPVASRQALALLRGEADEVVCLSSPPWFFSVGQHYDRFEQVSDEQVRQLLLRAGTPEPRP